MTRDECLGAICAAFDGVRVEATVGFWNVRVDSTPPCEVVLMKSFVDANIDVDGMTPGELTERVRNAPAEQWHRASGKVPALVLSNNGA